jgi:transcriptional regulator GlxA family with amidase domain
MRIAFILFDGVTWLDLIGVYEPLTKLKSNHFLEDLSLDFCGFSATAKDIFGFEVNAVKVRNDLSGYDAVIVPGGPGTRALQHDTTFISWLQTATTITYKISVCTGSLLLGAAGFLVNKNATTNFQEYEALRPYCRQVLNQRIVDDDNTITAGAVSSSIDLGIYLCKIWAGEEAAETIRRKIAYHLPV